MIHKRLSPVILLFLVGAALAAVSWAANSPQEKANLPELKKGIELFESVLNQSLAQTLGGPFETLDRARGAYLPAYGVVFSFEVNLTPLQSLGPFGPAPTPKTEQAQREEEVRRREKAKSVAQQTLGNFGQSLSPLAANESATIIIYAVAAHPGKIERSTIIVSAEKKLLDARVSGSLDQAHFIQKLSTTEY